jgi:Glycosyl transferases group 1
MQIIFITLVAINDINDSNLYADLMRYFVKKGHHVTIYSPIERREKIGSNITLGKGYKIVRVKSLNIQKTNIIEKGLATLLMDKIIKRAIKKNEVNSKFDLAIYSTPPITLTATVSYIKETFSAKTYLLLKDIFPQNAVDIGMMAKGSLLYNYFKNKEKKLYELSDTIGCMSQANVAYTLENNTWLATENIEICPNSIEVNANTVEVQKEIVRGELDLPQQSKIFVYGGNLGKPQGIDFLIQVLDEYKNVQKVFFIILGSGTEYGKLNNWIKANKPDNVILKEQLPKNEYNKYVAAADIGLICLDHRFTIPNYPSRLLSYLEAKKPVLLLTDASTDIGKNAEKAGFGKWASSNDIQGAKFAINYLTELSETNLIEMGNTGYEYLLNNYTVKHSYEKIINRTQTQI